MYVLCTGRASSKIILCTSACKSGSDRDHDMNGDGGNHGKRSDPAIGDNGEINNRKKISNMERSNRRQPTPPDLSQLKSPFLEPRVP